MNAQAFVPLDPARPPAQQLGNALAALERPDRGASYRPAPLPLWRAPDALARLRRMLPAVPPEGAALERFLPEAVGDGPDAALRHRAALASTLLAGLELGREGAASLSQAGAFGRIVVAPAVRRAAGSTPARDSAAA